MITSSALSFRGAVFPVAVSAAFRTSGHKQIFSCSEMAAPIEGKFNPRSEPFFNRIQARGAMINDQKLILDVR